MRNDQLVRMVAAVGIVVGYSVRTITLGNGLVTVAGYTASPFAMFLVFMTVIATPEILDRLPIGPTRNA